MQFYFDKNLTVIALRMIYLAEISVIGLGYMNQEPIETTGMFRNIDKLQILKYCNIRIFVFFTETCI